MYLAALLGWSEKVSYEGAALHNWYLPRMFRQFIWRHSRYRPTPSPDVEASLVLGMAYATLLRTLFTSRPAGVDCFDPLQTGRTFRSSPHSRLPSYCVPCRVLSRATCSVTGDGAVMDGRFRCSARPYRIPYCPRVAAFRRTTDVVVVWERVEFR